MHCAGSVNVFGVTIDIGRTKNPNKHAVVDKTINEIENEIRRLVFVEEPFNSSTLSLTVGTLNNRNRVKFKACGRYFLFFSANDSASKTMKNASYFI